MSKGRITFKYQCLDGQDWRDEVVDDKCRLTKEVDALIEERDLLRAALKNVRTYLSSGRYSDTNDRTACDRIDWVLKEGIYKSTTEIR